MKSISKKIIGTTLATSIALVSLASGAYAAEQTSAQANQKQVKIEQKAKAKAEREAKKS
ncbi:hypothetical protein [Aneurinibacillus tyrosinisolvens]|uniref:hypothetical protein n=1 Tax=Aneurinibacillus tyrosinisolvens TaxID=1443435 RepID=UPI000A40FDB4|nr:hypothetical protein [Aneurinibacillus tyrosinisolvens]